MSTMTTTTQPPAALRSGGNPFDLNARRAERLAARRAADEVADTPLMIQIGDAVIGPLPNELPIAVLNPILNVDVDLALIVQEAMTAASSKEAAAGQQMAELVVSLIVQNPRLPQDVVAAACQMGINLMGQDGWNDFCAARPSLQDITALVTALMGRYASLGEFLSSTEPSTGGQTSKTISGSSTESTPEVSSDTPATPTSSESAAPPLTSAE